MKVAANLYSLPAILSARGKEKEMCQLPSDPFSPVKGTWAGEAQLACGTDPGNLLAAKEPLLLPLPLKPGDGGGRG